MIRFSSSSFAIALAFPVSAAMSQEVETPAGVVEFVGLHHWTIRMIDDSMKVHAPGKPLGQCAAVLRSLGFPSAQSMGWTTAEGRPSTLVLLVEPQDSALVRYRKLPEGKSAPVPAWRDGYSTLKDHVAAFQLGAQEFGIHATRDTVLENLILRSYAGDSAEVRFFWRFLARNRNPQSAKLAERILLQDTSVDNRMVAAAILGAQRGRVRAWYALVKGMRDRDERVAAAAEMGLTSLLTGAQHPIDWRPALRDVRAMLDGTNVLGLRTMLLVLTKTKVDPMLARALIPENGGLVLDLLASHSPTHRDAAHAFLVRLAGRDLGTSADHWRTWRRGINSR